MSHFESLADLMRVRDTAKRGRDFEKLLAEIFKDAGFETHLNPTSARPRQTDLLAKKGSQYLIIEAKWTAAKINIAAHDEIKARLDRTASDMVGCIFSMSDFAPSIIEEVKRNRKQEILLFNSNEIALIAHDPWSLSGLIEQKRRNLRIHGDVYFLSGSLYASRSGKLPSHSRILELAKNPVPSLGTRHFNHFSDVMLIADYPNAIELGTSDDCYSLEFTFNRLSRPNFRNLISFIHSTFEVSGNGSFSFHQNGASWHGVGLESLFNELERRSERYAETPPNHIHHSEQVFYVDSFNQGLLIIRFLNEVRDEKNVYGLEVELRLPGIPLNLATFEDFSNTIARPMGMFKRLPAQGHWMVRPPKVNFKRIGSVVDWSLTSKGVAGVLCTNPFVKTPKASWVTKLPKEVGRIVSQTLSHERLVCELRDWLFYENEVDALTPDWIEIYNLGKVHTASIRLNWGAVTNRPKEEGPKKPSLANLKSAFRRSKSLEETRRQFGITDD